MICTYTEPMLIQTGPPRSGRRLFMNLSLFLKIKSVISAVIGFSMVFLTPYLLAVYGMSLDRSGTVMAQWSGGCLIGIGIICWYASGAGKSVLRDGILLALFICDSIGFVASLLGQFAGIANAMGWSTVGLWLFLAIGLGYYRFVNRSE